MLAIRRHDALTTMTLATHLFGHHHPAFVAAFFSNPAFLMETALPPAPKLLHAALPLFNFFPLAPSHLPLIRFTDHWPLFTSFLHSRPQICTAVFCEFR